MSHFTRVRSASLLKFNEDQPRDESGRFASGGGGGGGGADQSAIGGDAPNLVKPAQIKAALEGIDMPATGTVSFGFTSARAHEENRDSLGTVMWDGKAGGFFITRPSGSSFLVDKNFTSVHRAEYGEKGVEVGAEFKTSSGTNERVIAGAVLEVLNKYKAQYK